MQHTLCTSTAEKIIYVNNSNNNINNSKVVQKSAGMLGRLQERQGPGSTLQGSTASSLLGTGGEGGRMGCPGAPQQQ